MKKLGLSLLLILSGLCSFSYAKDYDIMCPGAGGIWNPDTSGCYCGTSLISNSNLKSNQRKCTSHENNERDIKLDEVEVCITDTLGNKGYYDENKKKCVYCEADLGEMLNIEKNGCEADPTHKEKDTKETPSPKDPDPVEKNANDATHVDHGLKCDLTRVMYGSCGMNIYNVLNIRQSDTETTATEFVQDFVLAATESIGIVLTFALVVSGLMIIFGGANENTASRGRQGIKYALIGHVIVLCSYMVIRLVQYLAAG